MLSEKTELTLEDIINESKEVREVKRVLSVKMVISGRTGKEISEIVNQVEQ